MRNSIFHQAIPCNDLEKTIQFYTCLPHCRVGRTYGDRVTFEFFGDQLVCHLDRDYRPGSPTMYPRHFGVTFKNKKDFYDVLRKAEEADLTFFQREFTRFEGRGDEHRSFFLQDPANNLVEFKYYDDPVFIY